MNRHRPPRRPNPWTAGDVMSWALGVTVGVILGLVLLIVTPRLVQNPVPAQAADNSQGASPAVTGADTSVTNARSGAAPSNSTAAAGTRTGDALDPQAGTSSAPKGIGTGSSGAAAIGETGSSSNSAATPSAPASGTTTPSTGTSSTGSASGTTSGGTMNGTGSSSTGSGSATGTSTATGDTTGNAENGKAVFTGTCAGCHGQQAEGGIGPNLRLTKTWTTAQLIAVLREGKAPERQLSSAMPHFGESQVSDAQAADILAWLKTLN